MLECPICETKYDEEIPERCSTCEWDLELVLITDETSLTQEEKEAKNHIIKKAIAWAKKRWQKYDNLKAEEKNSQPQPATQSNPNKLEEQLRETIERVYLLEKFEGEYQELDSKLSELIEKQREHESQLKKLASENTSYSQSFTKINQELDNIKNTITDKLQLESKFSRLNTQDTQLQEQITSLKTSSEQQLQSQSSQINLDIDNKINPLQTKLAAVENDLKGINAYLKYDAEVKLIESSNNNHYKDNQDHAEDTNASQSETEMPTKPSITREEQQLAEEYNQNSPNVLEKITEVSETQKSFSDRSVGGSQIVILEEKSRGIYGILSRESANYLFPSKSFRITDNNYKTVQALFKCHGYKRGYSENFRLLKPARVSSRSSNKQWQLQDRGILVFS